MLRGLVQTGVSFAALAAFLTGCASPSGSAADPYADYRPRPGQGQYVRPQYLNPQPTPRIPAPDPCRSRLYVGLIGQNEGAIFIPGLPGRKRVIKPATTEGFEYSSTDPLYDPPPYLEVREYLAGQSLYAPSIQTVSDRISLGPVDQNRLTIQLDREGYVQEVSCG